jgi:23S rRNA pseudouridine955/2504/2580 synthase
MPRAETAATAVRHIECGAGEDGQRIDNLLLRLLKGVPRSHVYRLLRKGQVRVNGRRARPGQRLAAGDVLRLPPVRLAVAEGPRRVPDALLAEVRAAVIHEDPRILALDKPAGLAVHGGSGLSFGAIEALRAARPDAELELVHRLDRDTSGVLVVAKDRGALRILHALLREGEVAKTYLALLKGKWTLGRKRIDAPLRTNLKQGGERVVRVHAAGKAAASTFTPVTTFGRRATLVEVSIHTGRTHQIRVHAAFAGHPVAGDDRYGDRDFNAAMKELGLRRMFLHARTLAFTWPDTGERCRIESPLPGDLEAVVERLGKKT